MSHLSYSFCLTILHSLWQAAALLLLFTLLNKSINKKINPAYKRNLLFLLIASQLLLSILTFYIYFSNQITGFTFFNTAAVYIVQNDIMQMASPWIFVAYLIVLLYKSIHVFFRFRNFQFQYKRGLQKPPADLKIFTTLHSNYFGIRRNVKLWLSNTVTAPITFGFFKPVILLPVALVNNLSIGQTETLILHELSHIKANDYLLNWFLLFTETIFFFNPFILALCNNIRMEREKACDISVLNFKYNPVIYAETLLLAERQKQLLIPAFQLAAVSTKQLLLNRIRFFSNSSNYNNSKRNSLLVSIVSSAFILAICAFTFIHFGNINKTGSMTENKSSTSFYADMVNEVNNPVYINNLVAGSSTTINTIVEETIREIKKQKPFIVKQIKNLAPLIKELQSTPGDENEQAALSYSIPVANEETDGTRRIIVKEEQSGSKNASVKVYTLTYKNGQWILIPEWKASAKERIHDSSMKPDFSAQ